MPTLHHFTDANFQAEVLNSSIPVLVDFTAVWCGPCKMVAPEIAKLNAAWNGAVKVGEIDADENQTTVMQYGVMGLPTLILFKGGQPVARLMGYQPQAKIAAALKPHLLDRESL